MRIASWHGCGRCAADLIDPTIAVHRGRVAKRTGDGSLVEFSSVVEEAVRCVIEVQNAMLERNAGVPDDLDRQRNVAAESHYQETLSSAVRNSVSWKTI